MWLVFIVPPPRVQAICFPSELPCPIYRTNVTQPATVRMNTSGITSGWV
jgi:hypothetical protein